MISREAAASVLFLFLSKVQTNQDSNLEGPWPILQVLILLHLPTPHRHNSPTIPLNTSIVLQEECQHQHHPLQTKDQNSESTTQFQNHSTIFLPHIGLQLPKKVPSPGEHQHRHGPLEDGSQNGGHHVSRVPPVGPHGGAARDGTGDGEDVEEDEEEAAERGNEAQREGEEDAAGGCTQEDVVAEKEHLVGVVVTRSDGGVHCGETHLGLESKDWNFEKGECSCSGCDDVYVLGM
uniref:Uncharacterized protein n=1 Tax=Cajanus cajan TaxID=3821 RepID=A0A151TAW5_CAJCA|nr:hypothetical protein KK1_018790 [Cajanus cajan]